MERYRRGMAKRALDVVVACAVLVLFSPVLAGLSLLIVVTGGRPVLFRQERIGLHGRPFTLVKFRTMKEPKAGQAMLLTDADRVTSLGAFMRNTSLDELPQLWNVLAGDMSLVGPRPLLQAHLDLLDDEQRRRHSVKPGVTGLAQVEGRQQLTFSQRYALDVLYVDTRSLALDARIIWRTITSVFSRSGVETGQAFEDVDDIGLQSHLRRLEESEGRDT